MSRTRDQMRGLSRDSRDGLAFTEWFPTTTAGDGRMRPNNVRPGKNQPDARPSQRRKVSCRLCGFLADRSKDTSIGDLNADGGGGVITLTARSYVTSGGVTVTYTDGSQARRAGRNCPLCLGQYE